MTGALILACGMGLDAIVGEPRSVWSRLPHPAVLMGRAIGWLDARLNAGSGRRLKGAFALLLLATGALLLGWALSTLGDLVAIVIVAILLAQKSLIEHVRAVADALRVSLGDGRRSVAMIVGRDTSEMTNADVARAAIESAAENLSDGVMAPAFWFLIGGLPGLLLYKVTNTADSMIGHRTEKHEEFGWAAARFDDLLNLVPARITAWLIAASNRALPDWPQIADDARRHRSPNAGWPEAAMARALGVALAGPRSYNGVREDFPFVNEAGKHHIGPHHVEAACRIIWGTWGVVLAVLLALGLVLG